MRAKLSSTADATYRDFAPPSHTAPDFFGQDVGPDEQIQPAPWISGGELQQANRSMQSVSADVHGEGLLHDARNLVSAIGLYCDLLSMPGVLKPEHRQYPEELRLLGTRSRVLIEHLMRSLASQSLPDHDQDSSPNEHTAKRNATQTYPADLDRRIHATLPISRTPESGARSRPVSLRAIVERCSGLLSRVADGRPIEFVYGPAADVPVWVSEEAIERILVNLVRNASQALDREPRAAQAKAGQHFPPAGPRSVDLPYRAHRRAGASSQLGSPSAIRISVGPLVGRIGEARSWPFQHVRLVVEDSGCGMELKQLHSLLSGCMAASRGTHGIGFRVVRELVAASKGDLRAASTPGIGTRMQIEWPVAATSTTEKDRAALERKRQPGRTLRSPTMEMEYRSIPPGSGEPAAFEGRQGAY